MKTDDFKIALLDYLTREKQFIENDIAVHKQLPDDLKEEEGFLIRNVRVVSSWGEDCFDLSAPVNNTRLRPGDRVRLVNAKRKIEVRVIENGLDIISVCTDAKITIGDVFDLEICEAYLLDSLHTVLEQCCLGTPGYSYLSQLAQESEVESVGMFAFAEHTIARYRAGLNDEQWNCCRMISQNPSIACLQGPPGTGKTKTLAAAANMVCTQGQQILVIAFTHQAVNNALNQIRKANAALPVIKVGDAAKAIKLDDSIEVFSSMRAYASSLTTTNRNGVKKQGKSPKGLVIGMTFHAALVNFGLQHPRCVFPTYLFLDEASQIPLTYAAALGTFGAGSICLFGDSRQMPPIFHPNLVNDPLSVSILDYCTDSLHAPSIALTTTYRMNHVITEHVSSHYYEPYGIKLNSARSEYGGPDSITWVDNLSAADRYYPCVEENEWEAKAIAERLVSLVENEHYDTSNVAVITPFRKQVIRIRKELNDLLQKRNLSWTKLPLIDTVERLQGQDVDVVIMSFSVSVRLSDLIQEQIDFLLNPNRLNVMISRAKDHVIVYSTEQVWERL